MTAKPAIFIMAILLIVQLSCSAVTAFLPTSTPSPTTRPDNTFVPSNPPASTLTSIPPTLAPEPISATQGSNISISGNLFLPQTFPGEKYEVIIDNDWDRGNGIIISVEGICSSSKTIGYTISNVPIGGPYYLYAFIPEIPSETTPTYIGYFRSKDGTYQNATLIDISNSSSGIINNYDISLYSVGIEIFGRLITPSEQTGKYFTVYVDTDTNPDNGYISKGTYTFGPGLEHNFGIGGQKAGEYYFYALSDNLKGYYGSDNGDPSNAQKVLIKPNDTTVHDIKLFEK